MNGSARRARIRTCRPRRRRWFERHGRRSLLPPPSGRRRRWWKLAGLTTLAGGVASAAGYFLLPWDPSTLTVLFAVLLPIVTLAAAPLVAGTVGRPHRITVVDRQRGFYRLWFENRAYADL